MPTNKPAMCMFGTSATRETRATRAANATNARREDSQSVSLPNFGFLHVESCNARRLAPASAATHADETTTTACFKAQAREHTRLRGMMYGIPPALWHHQSVPIAIYVRTYKHVLCCTLRVPRHAPLRTNTPFLGVDGLFICIEDRR
jgi:hypothetical protein